MIEGHFLQMGGILFYNNESRASLNLRTILRPSTDKCYGPVFLGERWTVDALRRELKHLHSTLGPEEIEDRSKSDTLSKTIVLVQTTWFTVQCIARAVQGLALTELEIVTLAYTALNGVMCFFWWKKPLDVQCPIIIVLKDSRIERRAIALVAKESDSNGAVKGAQETRSVLTALLEGQFRYFIESKSK